jgi:membrane glycosyltransferase
MTASADRGVGPDPAVPADRLLHDWWTATRRAEAYARALGEDDAAARHLARRAATAAAARDRWPEGATALTETLAALRGLLVAGGDDADGAPDPSLDAWLDWRLRRWLPADRTVDAAAARHVGGPPIARGSMGSQAASAASDPAASDRWRTVARRRRWLLAFLVVVPTVAASTVMAGALPRAGESMLEVVIAVFFGLLFAWISLGFWTAMVGAVLQVRGDRFAVTRDDGAPARVGPDVRTAIVMPICEEPVGRVFAGLRTIWESLEAAGGHAGFDLFVLSDTADPDAAMREEAAWAAWCRDVGGFGRLFYRRRRVRIARKSGNVADFCRRWGRRYRYMIVLDADSIMSGRTLMRLVELMEGHPDAAVIQTVPVAVNRRTTFARLQQFAGRLYGPLFAAGLHFWQLGDGQYWGHNAIIRVAPFMQECVLPRLSGRPPLGGRILSHDFVEAALLGRAGWTLWLAYDLGGSWEEAPPALLDEMERDRRWCQGNLQHLRLVFARGWRGAHRALFLNGAMSYASALLWLCFLAIGTIEALRRVLTPPDYFPQAYSLFPTWPVWDPSRVLIVLGATAVVLVLPKIVGVALVVGARATRGFGGAMRLGASALGELLASSLLAPIRMAFHSRFVLATLRGRSIEWVTPPRDDRGTPWLEALRRHGPHAVPAVIWAVTVRILDPLYFWWLLPVAGALVIAIPISVVLSRRDLGDWVRRHRWLLIPEETEPPPEVERLLERMAREDDADAPVVDGVALAIVDPYVNAIHRALRREPRRLAPRIRAARDALLGRALERGPAGLDRAAQRVLLGDPALVDAAHRAVWSLPAAQAARWGIDTAAEGVGRPTAT